ncbi:hypothetical protein C9I99_21350 [Photobacterium lutimaris]|uniref:Uncharacterized protein n=2 Tax=Photobacterium lutimaris TaxID=388278 RepID=A0A2T3ITP2_9GAMM|nr:hypothetical protein C9I99_21350 [Photobacterium lutimaris]
MWFTNSNGRPSLYSDAERRAYGQRKREEESAAWHSSFITVWRLKNERLWTDSKIAKWLGKPQSQGKYKVYYRKDVAAAESMPEFQEWLAPRLEKKMSKDQYFHYQPIGSQQPAQAPEKAERDIKGVMYDISTDAYQFLGRTDIVDYLSDWKSNKNRIKEANPELYRAILRFQRAQDALRQALNNSD